MLKIVKIISFFSVVLFTTALVGCNKDGRPNQSSQAVADVQQAWDEFKSASLSNKGDIAANRVTKATHEHYAEIRDAALNANRDEIQEMSVMNQITTLGMRIRVKPDHLRQMSGRDLFVHAVDQGWIGKNSATDEGITNIMVNGDHAKVEATKAGKPTGLYFHFIKEDGVWRWEMTQTMKFLNRAFDTMQKKSGLTEEEFVSQTIETVTGKRLTAEDWNSR